MAESIVICLSKDIPNVDTLLIGIVHVHASCITHDKTEATFLPPLSYSKMLNWWQDRFDEVLAGTRNIWVEVLPISSRRAQLESPFTDNESKPIHVEQDQGQEYEVAGVVALAKPFSETGPFRAEVHELLVSPNHRQKGVARRLLTALERLAVKEQRWYLMLDTEVGSTAEQVYPRLGYIPMGIVPEFGYSPVPGKMCDELWMYKDLRKGTL